MKTNLQNGWSKDIHDKVMWRSKNRNKTGYLRHRHAHTHLRTTWHTQRHTHWWWQHDLISCFICFCYFYCKSRPSPAKENIDLGTLSFLHQILLTFTFLTPSHHALCEQRRLLPGELLLWSWGGKPVEEGELPSLLAEPGHWNETTIQVNCSYWKCEFCEVFL